MKYIFNFYTRIRASVVCVQCSICFLQFLKFVFSWNVAQLLSEWFWNGSSCSYYCWYHFCFHIPKLSQVLLENTERHITIQFVIMLRTSNKRKCVTCGYLWLIVDDKHWYCRSQWSKAWLCSRSLAGAAGSNPACVWISVSCKYCVLSGRDLGVGLISRPNES